MKIELPIKIHNKFVIEVRDIETGEVVEKGYAENIVLNGLFPSFLFLAATAYTSYVGMRLNIGRGTGVPTPTRTILFNRIGTKDLTLIESVFNEVPTPSYTTKKAVITPAEYVGETITEVGLAAANDATIYTHAMIKDSEGNLLSLGPKTNTQEITIYSTVYFQPNFEPGITFDNLNNNQLLTGATCLERVNITSASGNSNYFTKLYLLPLNWSSSSNFQFSITDGNLRKTPVFRVETNQGNSKIKKLKLRGIASNYEVFTVNLEILAENESSLWNGWEFDKRVVGIGNGSQTTFALTWDEVWLTKPKKVYVDGVERTSGVTWSAGEITFDAAPQNGAAITADYWVKYAPKDSDHVLDVQFTLNFSEGVPV
jgi:hypothetical protein